VKYILELIITEAVYAIATLAAGLLLLEMGGRQ